MATCPCEPPLEGLAKLADDPRIIVAAYTIVLIPWYIIFSVDFISEKWRTVRNTRRLGYLHVVLTVIPMVYIVFYAHLQRLSRDYKEMMAAILFIQSALYHLARTTWGLMQLHGFHRWCRTLVQRMRTLNMVSELDFEYRFGHAVSDWKGMMRRLEDILKVNNKVVDNELTSNELAISLSRRKIRFSNPAAWLATGEKELTTVRWCAAFLSEFGDIWGHHADKHYLEQLFSACKGSLFSMMSTTFPINGARVSLKDQVRCGSRKSGVYDSSIDPMDVFDLMDIGCRRFELETVMNSYLREKGYGKRRHAVMILIVALMDAKALDNTSLNALRDYSAASFTACNAFGWPLLLWQNFELPKDQDADILSPELIPPFPWQHLMVPLWESRQNWRVFQASAHRDNIVEVYCPLISNSLLPAPKCYYSYMRSATYENSMSYLPIEKNDARFGWSGVIMETCRSFLAEWMCEREKRTKREQVVEEEEEYSTPNWCPAVPLQVVEFPSRTLKHGDLLWECQNLLHDRIMRSGVREQENLPACVELIMLFILSFPSKGAIRRESTSSYRKSGDSAYRRSLDGARYTKKPISLTPSSYADLESQDVPLLNLDAPTDNEDKNNNTNFPESKFFGTFIAPEDIKVLVQNDGKTISLKLIPGKYVRHFAWKTWINSAMGYIAGIDDLMINPPEESFRQDNIVNYQARTPMPADLEGKEFKKPAILKVAMDHPDVGNRPGDLYIWTGWPIFDCRIAHFEMNQWLVEAGFLHVNQHPVEPKMHNWEERLHEEVAKAQIGLAKIIEWCRDETSSST